MKKISVFDTTLRDGAQGESIQFSVDDKLNILKKLDELGVDYIEAGNPGSNPKDTQFFERVQNVQLRHAKLVAFGSTRRKNTAVEEDQNCHALLSAGTDCISIFGKSWLLHVTEVLRTTPEENLRMIADTVQFFKRAGKTVFFDAEHFFDGYKADRGYAMQSLRAAAQAGADALVLCDTNGGTLPNEVSLIVQEVYAAFDTPLGIHCHNDIGCAVACSLAAIDKGVTQLQGTYTGFGERCGNTNLSTILPTLQLKLGYSCIPNENMPLVTSTARYIADVANQTLSGQLPYVGKSAFAHKGGMHVDGVNKLSRSFEHIDPALVGNHRSILVSEVTGRTAIAEKLSQFDPTITKDSDVTRRTIDLLKEMEREGYQFESAGASLEIFLLKQLGRFRSFFELENFKIIGEQGAEHHQSSSAMVKVRVGERSEITAAEGDGPVHALDRALRKALEVFYPSLAAVRLVDYKVRVIEPRAATAAIVRVLIESTDGTSLWTTVGASADIIEASWNALTDSITYKLMTDFSNDMM